MRKWLIIGVVLWSLAQLPAAWALTVGVLMGLTLGLFVFVAAMLAIFDPLD